MDNGLSVTASSSSKSERRSKLKNLQSTSTSSVVMGFLSCLAWLYVAGRLWQDAENRTLLANLLKKHSAQILALLGCLEEAWFDSAAVLEFDGSDEDFLSLPDEPVYLDEISRSSGENAEKQDNLLDSCGILSNNCLPCLASTDPTVEKRRSLSSSPSSSRKYGTGYVGRES